LAAQLRRTEKQVKAAIAGVAPQRVDPHQPKKNSFQNSMESGESHGAASANRARRVAFQRKMVGSHI
jgi:hypothetical protein